jgi:hypothetical protein
VRPVRNHVQRHADRGEQPEDREHARRVELEHQLAHQVAEAGLGADELGGDRTQQRQHDRGLHAGKNEGRRARQPDPAELGPGAALERAHQSDAVRVDRAQADHDVDQHREDRDDHRDDDLRLDAEADPDHHQRRERDLGHGLQGEQVRVQHQLDRARQRDRRTQRDAERDAEHVADQHLLAGHQQVLLEDSAPETVDQRVDHLTGCRQDHLRHLEDVHRDLPGRDQHHEQCDRPTVLQPALTLHACFSCA